MKKYLLLMLVIVLGYNLHMLVPIRLPRIDLITLYFIGISSFSLSVVMLFLCGALYDILYLAPLGLTAAIYIMMYSYILFTRSNNHRFLFAKLMLVIVCIEWLLLSLYHGATISLVNLLFSAIYTVLLYVLINRFRRSIFST